MKKKLTDIFNIIFLYLIVSGIYLLHKVSKLSNIEENEKQRKLMIISGIINLVLGLFGFIYHSRKSFNIPKNMFVGIFIGIYLVYLNVSGGMLIATGREKDDNNIILLGVCNLVSGLLLIYKAYSFYKKEKNKVKKAVKSYASQNPRFNEEVDTDDETDVEDDTEPVVENVDTEVDDDDDSDYDRPPPRNPELRRQHAMNNDDDNSDNDIRAQRRVRLLPRSNAGINLNRYRYGEDTTSDEDSNDEQL